MKSLEYILESFKEYGSKVAIIYDESEYSYIWLYNKIQYFKEKLIDRGLKNNIIAFRGDYSPNSVALFFSLAQLNNVMVPLNSNSEHDESIFLDIAEVQFVLDVSGQDELNVMDLKKSVKNSMLTDLIKQNRSGLILFSSGTTGIPKAILHDFEKIISKYKKKGKGFITISFLLMDHIGGINTLLYQLANCGTIILTNNKSTSNICRLVEKYKANLLPVTPTFLNLILMSEDYKKYDLSSLKIVTYGTEVIPEMTLKTFNDIIPNVSLKQTYGLTELGILSSKSEDSRSRWVKLGGFDYQLKVVDQQLWIKTNFSMVGYLNAESPFDSEGWFNTQDIVETKGEYFRILGRKSDIINVGGLKVFPQEVENVILELPEIQEVTVSKEANAIMGNIVIATIKTINDNLTVSDLKKIVQHYCKDKLPNYKIPVKVYLAKENLYNSRFKKMRTERVK